MGLSANAGLITPSLIPNIYSPPLQVRLYLILLTLDLLLFSSRLMPHWHICEFIPGSCSSVQLQSDLWSG